MNLAPTKFGASAAALGNRSGSGTARSHDIFFRFLIRRDSLTCHFGADGDVVVDRGRLGRGAGHVLDPLRQVVRVVRNGEHVGQDADPGRPQLLGMGGLANCAECTITHFLPMCPNEEKPSPVFGPT